jgi:hypothetical protein
VGDRLQERGFPVSGTHLNAEFANFGHRRLAIDQINKGRKVGKEARSWKATLSLSWAMDTN